MPARLLLVRFLGLTTVMLVAFGSALLWPTLREQYHIRRLYSDDPSVRLESAERLLQFRSLRSVPRLAELVCQESDYSFVSGRVSPGFAPAEFLERDDNRLPPRGFLDLSPVAFVLHGFGADAAPAIRKAYPNLEAGPRSTNDARHTDTLRMILEAWKHPKWNVRRIEW